MSLQGSFETIALPDVMALLAASNKSGELRVVGGQVEGRLWLQRGQLVAAKVGKTEDHVDVMFELLRLTEGNFVFRDGVEAEAPAEPSLVDPVVKEAQERLTEWQDITRVVPSAEHRVRLIPELPTPEVTLSAEDWRLVMAVALAGTVQGVLEELHRGAFDGFRGVRRMVDAGLVLIDPPRMRPAGARSGRHLPAAEPAPEPVLSTPESDLSTPDSVFSTPEPVFSTPEPVVEADEPVVCFPEEPGQEHDEPSSVHPFPVAPFSVAPFSVTDLEPPADEIATPVGAAASDSINRGLLLKFLSSVRS